MQTLCWNNDAELFALMRQYLFTAVVGDVMDKLGLIHQFLPPAVQALQDDMVLIGRALTVLECDCAGTEIASERHDKPFGRMFEALDSLKENQVYLCTGASPRYACFGSLMATRALKVGASGAVIEGFIRDTRDLKRMGFPIFSTGRYAQDQGVRGRVVDFGCPLEFSNGVRACANDLIFGDIDGVLVVPRERETEIIQLAFEKVLGEQVVRKALQDGVPSEKVFAELGIM